MKPTMRRDSSISFNDSEEVHLIPQTDYEVLDKLFYTDDELATFRHDAFLEECGLSDKDLGFDDSHEESEFENSTQSLELEDIQRAEPIAMEKNEQNTDSQGTPSSLESASDSSLNPSSGKEKRRSLQASEYTVKKRTGLTHKSLCRRSSSARKQVVKDSLKSFLDSPAFGL